MYFVIPQRIILFSEVSVLARCRQHSLRCVAPVTAYAVQWCYGCVRIVAGYIEAVMVCSYCGRLHRGGYGVFVLWQVT